MTGSKVARATRVVLLMNRDCGQAGALLIFLAIVVVLSALGGGALVGHFFPAEDEHVMSPGTQIPREAAVGPRTFHLPHGSCPEDRKASGF